jgi:lysozyme
MDKGMQRVKAKGDVIRGLDVSHYDETIDFAKVKAAGYEFCWAKCTEGTGNVDPRYKANKAKAKAAGLLFGAYHFFRPGLDPIAQAEWFLKNAAIETGDFRPMLDWEVHQSSSDPLRAKQWLDRVERATGQKPIIYGPPYMLNDYGLPPEFANYALCVAHYGTLEPLVPAPWKVWSFHQFTDKGSVPGIPAADEDLDRFNGTRENLLKFTL